MSLDGAGFLAALVAGATALPLAKIRREYRPVAVFLVGVIACNALQPILYANLIRPVQEAVLAQGMDPNIVPLRGVARVAGHVYQALFLLWPAGIAALALYVFPTAEPVAVEERVAAGPAYRSGARQSHLVVRRVPWTVVAVFVVWVGGVAGLVIGYHRVRGPAAQPVYLAAGMSSLVVSYAAIVQWTWRRLPHGVEHLVVALIVVIESAAAASAYHGSVFARWPLAQVSYLVLYVVVALLNGGFLWTLLSGSNSKSAV